MRGGVREEQRRFCLSRGVLRALVVRPRLRVVLAVEGLPPGERRCLRESPGKCGSLADGRQVREQLLHVVDLVAKLIEMMHAAELPIDHAGLLDLAVERGDGGGIDPARDGDAIPQLVGRTVGALVREAEFGVRPAVDLTEQPPVLR